MIPHVGEYLSQVKARKDVMLAKVVKNIASWTRNLQVCIGVAYSSNDVNCLSQITSSPSKYYNAPDEHGTGKLGVSQEPYTQYQTHQFWHDCINPLLKMVSASNVVDQIKVEILGTLSNLTRFDLSPSETWNSLIVEYSLIKVMSEIMSPNDVDKGKISQEGLLLDMKVGVVIFCNQLCYCSTSAAKLVANTNLIHDLVNLWGECEYAANDHKEIVHFHVMSLCETLLQYDETRSIVLFGTGMYSNAKSDITVVLTPANYLTQVVFLILCHLITYIRLNQRPCNLFLTLWKTKILTLILWLKG